MIYVEFFFLLSSNLSFAISCGRGYGFSGGAIVCMFLHVLWAFSCPGAFDGVSTGSGLGPHPLLVLRRGGDGANGTL
jgi:hypothetical protein